MSFLKSVGLFFVLTFVLVSCNEIASDLPHEVSIIPKPTSIEVQKGTFTINEKTTFYTDSLFKTSSGFLRKYLRNGAGLALENESEENAQIVFTLNMELPQEGYELDISEEKITINASEDIGAFYAVQTLRQLMDPQLEITNSAWNKNIKVPTLKIADAPAFKYRGMHLDVGRHFFPKEFIKEYIDHLAMLKMNYFHWHLTEDQGWRIEIKQFPRLTEHAAFRNETLIGHYNDTPQKFDGQRYGGFYTQEEIREIVAYAKELNITIIPEIEMPGHAQAAVSAYPELGCTGEPVEVATKWGVFENIYCPNQKTFAFLKGVLDEVCELFPGEYIHIGGDEAPKAQWKNCSHCQKLIAEHNLGDENGLQSWFIREIETYLNSKGKKIIGWDEILEGGLAPNATVMSWRGTQGAIEAAKEGHDVILTPTSHCYFDYYQSEEEGEPLAIGGYLPLKKVYSFNPIPAELTTEETKFVLGAQGNVWTEYMKTTDQVEYMLFPRILAMSEVVWSGPTENMSEDYPNFLERVESLMKRLKVKNINTANHLYLVEAKIFKRKDSVFVALENATPNTEIYYDLNSTGFVKYEQPFPIMENAVLRSEVTRNGGPIPTYGVTRTDTLLYHKGVRSSVDLNKTPHPSYSAGGKDALINGIRGSDKKYGDSEWLGFWGEDLHIQLNFLENTKINTLATRFYHAPGQWIYAPNRATIEVVDARGEKTLETIVIESDPNRNLTDLKFSLKKEIEASSLVLIIPNFGTIPDDAQGAGNKAWTFIDEIIVE